MSSPGIQQAFVIFEQTLRVPQEQNARAKDLHPLIRTAVKEHLGELWSFDHLAGSYARRVQTGYLKDVDIIIGILDPDGIYCASATAALERLREAARSSDKVARTRIGVRAVKLTIAGEEFTVDVVPALIDPYGEVQIPRRLPDQELDDWTPAVPRGQTTASSARNEDCGGMYVPMVRIIKSWNRRCGTAGGNLLPSYVAEAILYDALTSSEDYADAMILFLENVQLHMGRSWPSIPNPGALSSYVDELLDDDRRLAAMAAAEASLVHARAAMDAPDDAAAAEPWQNVLGPAFPDAAAADPTAAGAGGGALAAAAFTAAAGAAAIAAARAPKVQGRTVLSGRSHRR